MSARHHLVPQFYLRNFADELDQVLLVDRDDFTRTHKSAVKNAAVEVGFYRIETEELEREEDRATHDPEIIEGHLSRLEGRIAPVVARLVMRAEPEREAGIKLSSVASEITGVSGRAMLEALIEGQRDPAALADLARRRLRSKIPALTEALTGRFSDHHAFLARVHLDLIDRHTEAIEEITGRIEVVIEPFRGFRELIATIPELARSPGVRFPSR